jgi:hypothetical protein
LKFPPQTPAYTFKKKGKYILLPLATKRSFMTKTNCYIKNYNALNTSFKEDKEGDQYLGNAQYGGLPTFKYEE